MKNSNKLFIPFFLFIVLITGFVTSCEKSDYTLTVNVNPAGAGTVTLNPSGGTYSPGTQVTLTAASNFGHVFSSWSGDISRTSNNITLILNSNMTVIANFSSGYTLTITVNPSEAGTVGLNPGGGIYTAGTRVTLTAVSNFGYTFSNWSGAASGVSNPTVVTVSSNINVTADFSYETTETFPPFAFEITCQDWVNLSAAGYQGVTSVEQTNTKTYNNSLGALELNCSLIAGDADKNRGGAACSDLAPNNLVNLTGKTLSCYLYCPTGIVPLTMRFFIQSGDYWDFSAAPDQVISTANQWTLIQAAATVFSGDADITQVRIIGLMIDANNPTYNGPLYLDEVNWQ